MLPRVPASSRAAPPSVPSKAPSTAPATAVALKALARNDGDVPPLPPIPLGVSINPQRIDDITRSRFGGHAAAAAPASPTHQRVASRQGDGRAAAPLLDGGEFGTLLDGTVTGDGSSEGSSPTGAAPPTSLAAPEAGASDKADSTPLGAAAAAAVHPDADMRNSDRERRLQEEEIRTLFGAKRDQVVAGAAQAAGGQPVALPPDSHVAAEGTSFR